MIAQSQTPRDPDGFAPEVETVVRHMIGCSPCREIMSLMSEDSARVMEAWASERASQTMVQRVLAKRARAGRKIVADLVFEMAKSCVAADAEMGVRVVMTPHPRDTGAVARAIEELASSGGFEVPPACAEAPRRREPPMQLAMQVTDALEGLEGKTPRVVIVRSAVWNSTGAYDIAEQELRELLRRDLAPSELKNAYTGLTRSLLRQSRGLEVVEAAREGLLSAPGDATLLVNAIMGSAVARERTLFESLTREFRGVQLQLDEEGLARACAPAVSTFLAIQEAEVLQALGLPGDVV